MNPAQSATTPTESGDSATLSRDDIFETLSNQRRRYVFHYLKGENREVYLLELAEHAAAWENGTTIDELTPTDRKLMKTALHQHHLPRMDENGFIEYDPQRRTVRLSDAAAGLEVYLDVVPGKDVPWGPLYLGLAVFQGALLAAVWLELLAVAFLPALSWAVFCVISFGVVGLAHTYLSYSRLRLGATDRPPDSPN